MGNAFREGKLDEGSDVDRRQRLFAAPQELVMFPKLDGTGGCSDHQARSSNRELKAWRSVKEADRIYEDRTCFTVPYLWGSSGKTAFTTPVAGV